MSLLNKVGILGSVFLLSSCAVATFPDFSDETEGQVLVAGEGLGSDADSDTLSAPRNSKITIAPEAVVAEDSASDKAKPDVHLMSEDEQLIQRVWQTYFKSIAIEARRNPRLHRQNMPRRFWKYLIEKKEFRG